MESTELPHLLFRWLHVVAGVAWVGQLWSLVLVVRALPGAALDPSVTAIVRRGYRWMLWAARLTLLSGIVLLGIVYYSGGAVRPDQSLGLAIGAGIGSIFAGWVLYDGVWMLLARQRALALVVSLALFTGMAAALSRVMIGRAVFIHLGAMLATIMLVNMDRRIGPVIRRLLAGASSEQPTPAGVATATLRVRHNAILAMAVLLFMISNHFPLVYGHSSGWLVAPAIAISGWPVLALLGGRG
jgi:uncharacterized membrane protein